MSPAVQQAVAQALSAGIQRQSSVAGGDINDAYRVTLDDGRDVFVKENSRADAAMFPAEARGLEWLAQTSPLRIPKVLAVSSGRAGEPAFLLLEYLAPGRPRAGFDEELGRGLAGLHRSGAECFGLDHDNFIGRLPQNNQPLPAWPEFYRERRLRAQLELAIRSGRVRRDLAVRMERLFERLDELTGEAEPPARLHGDLWGGNLHADPDGAPCLIDPAAYGGHREVDLAMMRLFGGFSERVFDAYNEAYPLQSGHAERIGLYQLYPLLVHVNLFGGSYAASVERIVKRYVG